MSERKCVGTKLCTILPSSAHSLIGLEEEKDDDRVLLQFLPFAFGCSDQAPLPPYRPCSDCFR